jgi:sugar phosphate isomerase/epimerase
MRPLALHQMNALDIRATELVSIAQDVGCEQVCVFVLVPLPDLPFEPVTAAMVPELLARMDATGVTVRNVEFFPLTEDVDIASFRPALELGARLGAQRLVTIIEDTVKARAGENLARLCDLAAEYDMKVGLEFMPITRGCTSIHEAANLVRLAGQPNLGFAVDCLHLVRSGGTPEDVAAVPTELFGYAQICDGRSVEVSADYMDEVFERTVPGEGIFPVAAILDALPAATPVDVEVPSTIAQQRRVPALERARRAATAARELLDQAQPTR